MRLATLRPDADAAVVSVTNGASEPVETSSPRNSTVLSVNSNAICDQITHADVEGKRYNTHHKLCGALQTRQTGRQNEPNN